MTRVYAVFAILLLAVAGAGGCGAQYVGLSGAVMYSNGPANAVVIPDGSFDLLAAGRANGNIPTDASIAAASTVHFSVYGDSKPGSITRSAHVMVTELTNSAVWEFQVEGSPGYNGAYIQAVEKDDGIWNEQLLYQEAENDWFSALWEVNGRVVPEMWICKRWSRTYGSYTRVVAEYREPMPEGIAIIRPGGVIGNNRLRFEPDSEEARRALMEFHSRANKVFIFGKASEYGDLRSPDPMKFSRFPDMGFNMRRLVGQARAVDRGDLYWDD